MSDIGEVYPSKRDWWLVALIIFSIVMMVFVAADLMAAEEVEPWVRYGVGGLSILSAIFCLWLLLGTRYVLNREELRIHCGPIRMRVKVADITEVYPTHNPLSSPALSLDRVMIIFGEGLRKRVMISPQDKEAFMRRLRLLRPELRPSEKGGLELVPDDESKLMDVD